MATISAPVAPIEPTHVATSPHISKNHLIRSNYRVCSGKHLGSLRIILVQLSAIIPTYSRFDTLTIAIDSLLAQQEVDVEVIVVDNASPERIGDRVARAYPDRVRVVRMPRNEFYCGAVNAGARQSEATHLAVLNDDARVTDGWAVNACRILDADRSVGSVASRVMKAHDPLVVDSMGDGLSISGLPFNRGWGQTLSADHLLSQEVFSAAGSCAVYRRHDFDEVGGFDEHFVAYLDDVDLGFRLQLIGKKCVYAPECFAFHEGGGTWKSRFRSSYLMERNRYWNLMKNMPTSIWEEARGKIVKALLTPAPLVGGSSFGAWFTAQFVANLHAPRVLRQRRYIQSNRKVEDAHIISILEPQFTGRCHL